MIALRGSARTTRAERMVMWWPVLTDSLKAPVNVMRLREERWWRPLLCNRGDTLGKKLCVLKAVKVKDASRFWSHFISLKGKIDNLSSVRKKEASPWFVAIEYLSLASLHLFTVFKTDNAGCLNKSVTYLEAHAWNQHQGRTSQKSLENIVS